MSGQARPGVKASVMSALALVMAGCDPVAPQSPERPGGYFAVVGAGRNDPLWPVLQAAAARFQRTSATYRTQAVTPQVASAAEQEEVIQGLPRDGLRGLCVHLCDPRASRHLLESLRAEGMVVITMMRPVEATEPFVHSGFDQRELGVALADALAAQIPGHGTVALLWGGAEPTYRLRRLGFASQVARHPRLTLLRELDCSGDPATAVRLMHEAMERFPGLDGWASLAAWPLQHVAYDRPLPAGCNLVVPGPVLDLPTHITFGHCQAAIVPDCERIVTRALEMCAASLDPNLPPPRGYRAPLRRVTRDNLSEFERDWAKWTGADEDDTQHRRDANTQR